MKQIEYSICFPLKNTLHNDYNSKLSNTAFLKQLDWIYFSTSPCVFFLIISLHKYMVNAMIYYTGFYLPVYTYALLLNLSFQTNIAKQKLLPQTELRQYKQFLKHPLPKFGWLLKKQTIKS